MWPTQAPCHLRCSPSPLARQQDHLYPNHGGHARSAEIKGRFYARRDVSMMVYFILSAWSYFSDSVPLALVVANLNL